MDGRPVKRAGRRSMQAGTMMVDRLPPPPDAHALGVAPARPRADAGRRRPDEVTGTQERPDPLELVREATERLVELRTGDRELRFERTDHGLRIEVYDGLGRLVRRIPPTEALWRA